MRVGELVLLASSNVKIRILDLLTLDKEGVGA